MLTLLYEEDLDRAYYREIADEIAERRAELEQAIEDCETHVEDMTQHGLTPGLLALTKQRLAGYKAELARLEVEG